MVVENKIPADIFSCFFNDGTCTEIFANAGDAVAVASGIAGGQPVYAILQKGSALSAKDIDIFVKTYGLAASTGRPVVCFYQSGGFLLDEGLAPLKAAALLNKAAAKISGVVPQLAVVLGVCGGSCALAAANADICIMAEGAELFLTAPFTAAALGEGLQGAGSAAFAAKAGVATLLAQSPSAAIAKAAEILALLPGNNLSLPSGFEYEDPAQQIDFAAYNAQQAISAVADANSAIFLSQGFGGDGMQVALATIGGLVAGFVATGGANTTLCFACATKAARFVRFCDAFSIPVVSLINTGGFAQSSQADLDGGLRSAARLAATYADASTARVAVLTGKAVGSAFVALACADITIAVEGRALVAPAEPSAVVSVLYKEEIQASEMPVEAATAAGVKEYSEKVASASAAQCAGLADIVVQPQNLRKAVEDAVNMLLPKREQRLPKKHGSTSL